MIYVIKAKCCNEEKTSGALGKSLEQHPTTTPENYCEATVPDARAHTRLPATLPPPALISAGQSPENSFKACQGL